MRETSASRTPSVALVGVLVAVAMGLGGFVLGRVWHATEQWPSYASVFERVAPVVVNVAVAPDNRVGSGFAVSDNEVVTAMHLVAHAQSIVLRGVNGWEATAEVVGTDARSDLALLRLRQGVLHPATLGASQHLRVGDTVMAIGNPYGLGHSLSAGVVGHRGRRLSAQADGPRVDFLQLSMALNPGNSGGPILDQKGEVVGLLTGTHPEGQGIAFAVPVEVLREVLPQLRQGARLRGGYLGVRTRRHDNGLYVTNVVPSSPADAAGLRRGDVLRRVEDQRLVRPEELKTILDARNSDSQIELELVRNGDVIVVLATLEEWASQPVVVRGMTLRPAPGTGGRVVAVRPRSRAERAGVKVGDVVRVVNGAPVRAPVEIRDRLSDGAPAQLSLVREAVPVHLSLGGTGSPAL